MKVKRFQGTTLKEVGENGTGLAVFATFNVIDKDGDVTLPGAFGEQQAKVVPAHDWGHVPLGKAKIHEQGNDALADFKLNLDIGAARDWHSALKFDLAEGTPLQEWSYAYDPVKFHYGDFNGQRVRFLEKLKVHEVSPVLIGAGEGTRTLMMKSLRGRKLADHIAGVRADLADLVDRVKELKQIREAEGRKLSADRLAELAGVQEEFAKIAPLYLELEQLAKTGAPAGDDEARKLFSHFIAITSGLNR